MTRNNRNGTLLTIPNLLSGFRLIAAPFLLCIAWFGHHNMFLVLLAISLFTDSIDGFIARRLKVASEIGSKLDSWGDMATYLTLPLCAWWLWPEILRREALYVILVLAAFVSPLIAGFLKYRSLPSYHTWAAKISAVLISVSAFMIFVADISWPFRIAVMVQVLVACEEIAITIRLTKLQSNVRSFWHVNRQIIRRERGKNQDGEDP